MFVPRRRVTVPIDPEKGSTKLTLKMTSSPTKSKVPFHKNAYKYFSPFSPHAFKNKNKVKPFDETQIINQNKFKTNQMSNINKNINDDNLLDLEACHSPCQSPKSLTLDMDIHNSPIRPPESILLHKKNKLFWRINRTIDLKIYVSSSTGAIVIRSYDPTDDIEFEPIVLDWEKVVHQINESEKAVNSHKAELHAHTSKMVHEEDEIFKRIRLEKAALARKSRRSSDDEDILKAQERLTLEKKLEIEKELESSMKNKIINYLISKFEAIKTNNEIKTFLSVKNDISLSFDDGCLPIGVQSIGEDDSSQWNKKECSHHIRRHSAAIVVGLEETSQVKNKAHEQIKAAKSALKAIEMFKSPKGVSSNFKKAVNRSMFRRKLQQTKDVLSALSPMSPKSNKIKKKTSINRSFKF